MTLGVACHHPRCISGRAILSGSSVFSSFLTLLPWISFSCCYSRVRSANPAKKEVSRSAIQILNLAILVCVCLCASGVGLSIHPLIDQSVVLSSATDFRSIGCDHGSGKLSPSLLPISSYSHHHHNSAIHSFHLVSVLTNI